MTTKCAHNWNPHTFAETQPGWWYTRTYQCADCGKIRDQEGFIYPKPVTA
jgi:hypothetical protein